jgi:nucleoside-diphosphate-sugar epimerase
VADNLSSTHSLELIADIINRVEFHHVDVRCAEDMARLPRGRYDRVYHLAASFANELSVEYPALDARTNADGTANVLEFAAHEGCDLFVYTGSSSSYGNVPLPMAEDEPMRPQTPYARHKLKGEEHVLTSGLPYVVFRLFNVYGPGDIPGRYSNAIPNMMHALGRPNGHIRIFGREAGRDFNFVDDVVAYLLEPEPAEGCILNLGTGLETPVVELAHMLLDLFDLPNEQLQFEAPRGWDRVSRRVADIQRLTRVFGARQTTDLWVGLQQTAQWLYKTGRIPRGPR